MSHTKMNWRINRLLHSVKKGNLPINPDRVARFHIICSLFIGIIMCSLAHSVSAQSSHLSSRNLGLGGGGAAYMENYQANFINPANLSLQNNEMPSFTVGVFGGGASAGGPLANVGVYNKYMTSGKVLNNVADEMYDAWFGPRVTDAQSMGASFNAVPLGLAYRFKDWSVSFAYRNRTLSNIKVNRGTAEFLTFLLDDEQFGEPRPVNFEINFMSVSELSFGVSKKIWDGNLNALSPELGIPVSLHVGAAPKILLGHNSMNVDFNSDVHVRESSTVHDFNYTIRSAGKISQQLNAFYQDRHVSGEEVKLNDYLDPSKQKIMPTRSTGLGVDFGVNAEFGLNGIAALDWGSVFRGPKFARIGISITDIGSVKMGSDAEAFSADEQFVWEGFEDLRNEERINSEFDSSTSKYIDHVTDSIANNVYLNYAPQEADEISNGLPTMLHIGTQFQMGRAGLMIDIVKGLRETGMTTRQTSAAFGLEYNAFGFWPLRIGLRSGGMGATSYSFGTGLEFRNFEFSFSAMSVKNSINGGYYLGAAMSGLVFHF